MEDMIQCEVTAQGDKFFLLHKTTRFYAYNAPHIKEVITHNIASSVYNINIYSMKKPDIHTSISAGKKFARHAKQEDWIYRYIPVYIADDGTALFNLPLKPIGKKSEMEIANYGE